MVKNDTQKPWDVRLIESMQRGTDGTGSGKWTPKQRAVYGVFWIVWMSIVVSSDGGVEWWVFGVLVVLGAAVQAGMCLWERRRST
jgi:hypothetical protein